MPFGTQFFQTRKIYSSSFGNGYVGDLHHRTEGEVIMVHPRVAIVSLERGATQAFKEALKLIGKIDDLNTPKRAVVVKVGIFDPKGDHHTSVDVTGAIIKSFNKAPQIYVAESDNYRGTGFERLQKWKSLFSKRVVPFNLSEDPDTKQVKIADEKIALSHLLFKPNVVVSTHVLRTYEQGSVLKNLLGMIPDRKKARFHKKLATTLIDVYEAIGGIDLAVLDGTHIALSVTQKGKRVAANVLVVGRDALSVEVVGAVLVGLKPQKVPVIREAVSRGIGEGDINRIDVVGTPLENLGEKFQQLIAKEK
jgi:uncharacterized protein (DUF362 family)